MEQALVVEQETLGVRRGEWKGLGKEGRKARIHCELWGGASSWTNSATFTIEQILLHFIRQCQMSKWGEISSLLCKELILHIECLPAFPLWRKALFFFLAFCRFCICMLFSCRCNLKRVKSSMVYVGSEWFFADFYKKSADPPLLSMGCNL